MNQKKAGIILSYISEFVRILSGIIYTPIMLRILGQGEYGLYQLVYSVVSSLSLLSFGFGSSYIRFYSRYNAKKDDKGIAILNGMFLMLFMGIAILCVFCGCIMYIHIEEIFARGLTREEYPVAKTLMILMILNLSLTFPNSVFDSLTSANECFLFQKLLIVLQNLLNPFITLPLLLMGYGSVAMVIVTTSLTFSKLVINIWYCLSKIKVKFCFSSFPFELLKEMCVFTFFIFINMIVDQVNWSVDKFLLGRLIGTVSVAIYGVGGQLNTLFIQLSTAVSNVFIPKVNKIVSESNDNELLTEIFIKVGRVQFVILMLILSGFIFLGSAFIKIWVGDGYETSYIVAILLMTPVLVPLIQNIGIEIQRAKNMHQVRSLVYLGIAIGNIFLSIPLIKLFSEVGAAIGTSISLFWGNILFMNWYYQAKIGLNIIRFWKEIFKFIPALIIPFIVGIIIKLNVHTIGIFEFCFIGILYTFVYCISIWVLGLNKEEKNMIGFNVKKYF